MREVTPEERIRQLEMENNDLKNSLMVIEIMLRDIFLVIRKGKDLED